MVEASPGRLLLLNLRLVAYFSLLLNSFDTVETEQEALKETLAQVPGKNFLLASLVMAVARRMAGLAPRGTSFPHGNCLVMVAARQVVR